MAMNQDFDEAFCPMRYAQSILYIHINNCYYILPALVGNNCAQSTVL